MCNLLLHAWRCLSAACAHKGMVPLLLLRGCRGMCHVLADVGSTLEEGWGTELVSHSEEGCRPLSVSQGTTVTQLALLCLPWRHAACLPTVNTCVRQERHDPAQRWCDIVSVGSEVFLHARASDSVSSSKQVHIGSIEPAQTSVAALVAMGNA